MSFASQPYFKQEGREANRERDKDKRSCCSSIYRSLTLSGHFNYAFIYGSWEVIRARKVGTTRTKVDYVVYRLFYPVVLIGACLFAVVEETRLTNFFSLFEVWCMILQISYSFIFLQNVLSKNVHRVELKGKQKIPERLVVTEEIVKGSHKYFICKRFSILPTDNLCFTEKILWLAFNMLASPNISIWLGHVFGQIKLAYKHSDHLEQLRSACMGLLAISDVLLTPIPIRFAHVVYPLGYCGLYSLFVYLFWLGTGNILYNRVDWQNNPVGSRKTVIFRTGIVAVTHCILVGLSKLRDYVISVLDDSRTSKQLQNLRSQKRLARRKFIKYVEGDDDGKIIVKATKSLVAYHPLVRFFEINEIHPDDKSAETSLGKLH